ncbi:MAG TPA: bifunctional DNA-formamidopyrimidine glycosylase/DNA-(apurinic or apyrimidinic site) lyase [Phycisphaerae bacterium]|nr:bifunctional DNA-formamidopyrimidine glycosylase/DNA-(apurinic or apyrimidinic site) lyase [Phycisphaerae bacterium]
MPELPEVEEVRRTLESFIKGSAIQRIQLLRADYLRHASFNLNRLLNHCVQKVHRHGKTIFCQFDDQQTLVFHLGMTGRLICLPRNIQPAPHTHIIFELSSGHDLHVTDPRRFGGVWHYANAQEALFEHIDKNRGVDALQLNAKHLAGWSGRKIGLKAELLSQRSVAGLGNIYVDEALWRARLHPMMRIGNISATQLKRLISAIQKVLLASIHLGGTTLRDYRNVNQQKGAFAARLRVYGHSGRTCRRCKHKLKTITISGRTTVFCPRCQHM